MKFLNKIWAWVDYQMFKILKYEDLMGMLRESPKELNKLGELHVQRVKDEMNRRGK